MDPPGTVPTFRALSANRDPKGRAPAATGAVDRVGVGIAAALVTVWAVLRLAAPIGSRVSERIIHLLFRIMGLLLASVAVELAVTGARDGITTFG